MHQCTVKFPDTSSTVIPVVSLDLNNVFRFDLNLMCSLLVLQLMEFLSDTNELAASDVLIFVREAIHRYDHHKQLILDKLLEIFSSIKNLE